MSEPYEALPVLENTREKPEILLADDIFLKVLDAADDPSRAHNRETMRESVQASSNSIFRYVGRIFADILDEPRPNEVENDEEHMSPVGSSHQLEGAVSPVVMAAGMVWRVKFPFERAKFPEVNGWRNFDDLTTDAERAEWHQQTEEYEHCRKQEIQVLKMLAVRYTMGAVRAYEAAVAAGDDIGEALRGCGVPAGAINIFQQEVTSRVEKIQERLPGVLEATLRDMQL